MLDTSYFYSFIYCFVTIMLEPTIEKFSYSNNILRKRKMCHTILFCTNENYIYYPLNNSYLLYIIPEVIFYVTCQFLTTNFGELQRKLKKGAKKTTGYLLYIIYVWIDSAIICFIINHQLKVYSMLNYNCNSDRGKRNISTFDVKEF